MKADSNIFTLQPDRWFAMECSTLAEPDCSPVKILTIEHAGGHLLEITIYEAFYPEGVREKSFSLRVQAQTAAGLTGSDDVGRQYVFLELTREWLLAHFKHEDVSQLLDSAEPHAILESVHFGS